MRFILHIVIGFNNLLFVVCQQHYHILYIYHHLKQPGMTPFKVTLDLESRGRLVGGFTATTRSLQFFSGSFFCLCTSAHAHCTVYSPARTLSASVGCPEWSLVPAYCYFSAQVQSNIIKGHAMTIRVRWSIRN